MKMVVFCLLVFLGVFYLSGCESEIPDRIEQLQKMVDRKVEKDIAALATFESTYSLVFKNVKEKTWFQTEQFYIREETARVPYGYELSDIKIQVVQKEGNENDGGILLVRLPAYPKRLPIDRKINKKPISTHANYQPLDAEGNPINVDAALNRSLRKTLKMYESRAIEDGRNLTRQYFSNLAHSLGLDLDIKFKD